MGQASIKGEYSIEEAHHAVGGSGSKSLLLRGAFTTQEGKLAVTQPLRDHWSWVTNLRARRTTDVQIDKRHDVHLLGLTSEVYNRIFHATAGDFYGDFSQYSLAQALQGAQLELQTNSLVLKAVSGFSQFEDEGRQFMRLNTGGYGEWTVIHETPAVRDFKVGVGVVNVNDVGSSLDNASNVAEVSGQVTSVKTRAMLWNRVDLEAEAARSWSDEDVTPGTSVPRKNGTAMRLNATAKVTEKSKLRLAYDWAGARFRSFSGSANPDRLNVTSRLDYKWNSLWSATFNNRVSSDKLDKSTLNKRTITISPQASLTWTPLTDSWRVLRDLTSRLYWDARRRLSQEDNSGQTDFVSHEVGWENDFSTQKLKWTTGWSIRREDDDLSKANDRLVNSGWLGWRYPTELFRFKTTPWARWQFNYENRPKEGGRDLTHTVSFGADTNFSEGLKFQQRYTVSIADRMAAQSDTTKWNAYLSLEYRLPTRPDLNLSASYEYTNFDHPIKTEKYSEHNTRVRMLWKF